MIENYLHHYLHKARAVELQTDADTWRHATRTPRRTPPDPPPHGRDPDMPAAGHTGAAWWRKLRAGLAVTLHPSHAAGLATDDRHTQ